MTDNSTSNDSRKGQKMISISYTEWQQIQKELKELKFKYNKEKKEKEDLKNLLDQALNSIDAFEASKKNIENMFNILKKKITQNQELLEQKELKEQLRNNSKAKLNKEKEEGTNNKCSTAHTTNNDIKFQNFKSAFIDNFYNFVLLEGNKESKDKRNSGSGGGSKSNENKFICEPVPSFIKFMKKY